MSNTKYSEVWQYALDQIHQIYKKDGLDDDFKLWFNMQYVEDNQNVITVSVASEFMWQTMLKKGNIAQITKKIEELTGQSGIELSHVIKESQIAPENTTESVKEEVYQKKTEKPVQEKNKHPQLRDDFTFETFVPGENSNFAYNAALAVAKNPGKAYNPILLYGGSGLGKTHLMNAIGNYIYQKSTSPLKICYISAETFTNEFTYSISSRTTEQFKSKYRNLDVLLLDDIHFLQNKPQTQEELFYTFNALRDANKQMVFTCDRPITELKDFAARVQNRISSGICIDLQPPKYETRRAILLKKLELKSKSIPEEVIDYIAKNIETNVRDLESALNKMIGYSEIIQKPLTIEIAQQQLRDIFTSPVSGNISIETVQKVVADYSNVSISDIKNPKRDKKFVIPRQMAIYISRELTEYSFTEIGREFGGRDHSTIMHAYEKIDSMIKTDSLISAKIQELIKQIKDYKK